MVVKIHRVKIHTDAIGHRIAYISFSCRQENDNTTENSRSYRSQISHKGSASISPIESQWTANNIRAIDNNALNV